MRKMKISKTTLVIGICSIVLLICVAVNRGFRRPSNLPEKFKENLDYTLGEYSVGDKKKFAGDNIAWQITFTDKNGVEQNVDLYSYWFKKFEEEYYGSKDEYDENNLYDFYDYAVIYISKSELWDNVVSKYFDFEYIPRNITIENNEIILDFYVSPVDVFNREKSNEFIKKIISAEDGIRLCEEDLSSLVSKDYMSAKFTIHVKSGADPEAYVEKAKAVLDDFEEYAPQNYEFEVIDYADRDKIYFSKYKLFGEKIDESELVDDTGEPITFREAHENALGLKKKE